MEAAAIIGLDLAKNVFQIHGVATDGGVVFRRQLRRAQMLTFFKSQPPCLIGMEACASAHFWARELLALGHEVRLMPPAYVKAYVKRGKTDAADAEAIAEAVTRPTMRFVAVKTKAQQAVLMLHKTRDLLVRQRTMIINALQWGGVVHWAEPGERATALAEQTRAVRLLGGAARTLDRPSFAQLAPGVIPGEIGHAVFRPHYGVVDPMEAVRGLADAGQSLGVRFAYGCAVRRLHTDAEGVVRLETNQGDVRADAYVLAAGADVEALAEMAGQRAPIQLVSGTLAHSRPHPRVLNRVINSPAVSIKQDPSGRIVTGLDYRPGADGTDISRAYGERLLAIAAQIVPGARGAQLERMSLGYVPIPGDVLPIVGFSEQARNLYVLASLSGITMAPLLGRLAATEIIEGGDVALLSPYRPARFA